MRNQHSMKEHSMSDLILPRAQLLIGGEWGDATDCKRFETLNPANETQISEVAQGGPADIDASVAAARLALETAPCSQMSGAQRGRLMSLLAAFLRPRREELVLRDR